MVIASGFFALLVGLPLGIILTLTAPGGLKERASLYRVLDVVTNVGRSFPFAILLVVLIPLTRFIVGTSLGTTAAIVPLTMGAVPFMARLVEGSLKEVGSHLVEAAIVMGSTPLQIVKKVLIPEALPSLINGVTLLLTNLVGYSAMAGLVGGGGLGQVAIQYGYQRFNPFMMGVTVFLLILLVQAIQMGGNYVARYIQKKRGVYE